jgi:hypothetical protein
VRGSREKSCTWGANGRTPGPRGKRWLSVAQDAEWGRHQGGGA